MEVTKAVERLRDGADTLLRELDLTNVTGVPAHSDLNGVYTMTPEYVPNRWSGFQYVGFLTGRLWLLSGLYPDGPYRDAAEELCRRIEPALSHGPVEHENAGFDILYALCLGYNASRDDWYRDAAMRALDHFSALYRPELRLFLCEADSDEVVVDTAGPLSCFLWGGQFDSRFMELISTHLMTILELGLVREDGSVFQGAQFDLDTFTVKRFYARQGYQENSQWTRAQAWAVHNYLNGFEATGEETFLDVSVSTGEWFWSHLPDSMVNSYDYDDPRAPEVPWDTCSSAMVANAFLRLGRLPNVSDGTEWTKRGQAIVEKLCADHLTLGGTLLHGSWGNARYTRNVGRFPQEDVMCYGNYWIAEALFRSLSDDWNLVSLQAAPHKGGSAT